MSRRKKTSSLVLDSVQARAAGLESIDAQLDLGSGLTLAAFKTAIGDTQAKLAAYNTLLSQVDEAANGFAVAERNLRDMRDRTLAGVAPASAVTACSTKWPAGPVPPSGSGACPRARRRRVRDNAPYPSAET